MTQRRRPGPTTRVRVTEWRGTTVTHHEDRLTTEEPLEIRLSSPGEPPRRLGVTMRTPGHDFELAVGLARGEQIIGSAADVETVAYCRDRALGEEQEYNVVTLNLTGPPGRTWQARQLAPTSACGVCGTDALDEIMLDPPTRRSAEPISFDPAVLAALPSAMRPHQAVFDRTGGIHAAGIFTPEGRAVVVREDVGRHNAVDKAIGHCLLEDRDASGLALCTSGRLGFEIAQKAVVAGLGVVVAVGAPSSLAVRLAERAEVSLVGFVRDGRMVVYHDASHVGPIQDVAGTEHRVTAPTGRGERG